LLLTLAARANDLPDNTRVEAAHSPESTVKNPVVRDSEHREGFDAVRFAG